MFLPNNTRVEKVMNTTDDGEEELMVEQREITEMVYWDMVGHRVLYIDVGMVTLSYIDISMISFEIQMLMLLLFAEQGGGHGHTLGGAFLPPLGSHNGNSNEK